MKANITYNNIVANVNASLASRLNKTLSLNNLEFAGSIFSGALKPYSPLFLYQKNIIASTFGLVGEDLESSAETSSITSSASSSKTSSIPSSGTLVRYKEYSIGKTVMGRDIMAYQIGDINNVNAKKILLVSGLHGYEGYEVGDTEYFQQMLLNIVQNYKNNAGNLDGVVIYVVPCVNLDGMINGYTENGPGRCNANGFDLNRCFSERYVEYTSLFNYNVGGPFPSGAPEAIALRDFVISIQPDYVIDVHGYEGSYIGNASLAKLLQDNSYQVYTHDFTIKSNGYFSTWAELSGNAKKAVLYELPPVTGNVYNFFKTQEKYLSNACDSMIKDLTTEKKEESSVTTSSIIQEVTSVATPSKVEEVTSVTASSESEEVVSSQEESVVSSDSTESTIGTSNVDSFSNTSSITVIPTGFNNINNSINDLAGVASTFVILGGIVTLVSIKLGHAIKNSSIKSKQKVLKL